MFSFKKKPQPAQTGAVAPGVADVPEAPIALKGEAKGVKAYNKKAIYLGMGVLAAAGAVAIGISFSTGGTPPQAQDTNAPKTSANTLKAGRDVLSELLKDLPDGALPVPVEKSAESPALLPAMEKPVPSLAGAPSVPNLAGVNPAADTQSAQPPAPTAADQYKQAMEQRRYQLAQGAFNAPAPVQAFDSRGKADTPNPYTAPATVEGFQRESVARAQLAPRDSLSAPMLPRMPNPVEGLETAGYQNAKSKFLKEAANQPEDYYVKSTVAQPITPYEVKAGSVIPGVMVSGINSDLPNGIIGVVKDNVYDSVTGNHLLIPMGTKIIGTYDSKVAFGQERVLVAWNRLIMPNGTSFDIRGMPGTDGQGYAGFKDQVNNHYMKSFGAAILYSLFSGGVQFATDAAKGAATVATNGVTALPQTSARESVATALGQNLGQLGSQLIQRNMDVQPTLEIRPGYKFQILVAKDLVFPTPYGK